jgi:hypothetical protein
MSTGCSVSFEKYDPVGDKTTLRVDSTGLDTPRIFEDEYKIGLIYRDFPMLSGTHCASVLTKDLMHSSSSSGQNEGRFNLLADLSNLSTLRSGLNSLTRPSGPLYAFIPSKQDMP